jgi:hypothetical protein
MASSQESSATAAALVVKATAKRRKDLFGDCALVEIIHLHDCLRGALNALERDVNVLSQVSSDYNSLSELERRVAGRFKVIWSVFRAHSSAEDEFIWPTLQSKTGQGKQVNNDNTKPSEEEDELQHAHDHHSHSHHHHHSHSAAAAATTPPRVSSCDSADETIEQEEYEEDHADEERMFSMMDSLLTRLRSGLVLQRNQQQLQQQQQALRMTVGATTTEAAAAPTPTTLPLLNSANDTSVNDTVKAIQDLTKTLSKHLMAHLEKEENNCMPVRISSCGVVEEKTLETGQVCVCSFLTLSVLFYGAYILLLYYTL